MNEKTFRQRVEAALLAEKVAIANRQCMQLMELRYNYWETWVMSTTLKSRHTQTQSKLTTGVGPKQRRTRSKLKSTHCSRKVLSNRQDHRGHQG